MTTGNRSTTRAPGRTPPFVLVGLLVILGFLGYSYWSLYSANSDLAAELEKLRIQKRDIDLRNSEAEKNLENSREELRSVQGSLDLTRKQLQDKDSELNNAKTDLAIKQTELDKYRNQLSQCDSNASELKNSLELIKNEKAEVERQLSEIKQKQVTCDLIACSGSIRDILVVVAKATGSDVIAKALAEANIDSTKIMEGVLFPAPGAAKLLQPDAQDPKAQQQPEQKPQQEQQQQQQQQGQNQPQAGEAVAAAAGAGGVKESKPTEESNKTEEVHIQANNKSGSSDLLVKSERDKNIADLTSLITNEETTSDKAAASGADTENKEDKARGDKKHEQANQVEDSNDKEDNNQTAGEEKTENKEEGA